MMITQMKGYFLPVNEPDAIDCRRTKLNAGDYAILATECTVACINVSSRY